jgi:hypothetical protein
MTASSLRKSWKKKAGLARPHNRARPRLEALEDRCLPSGTVTIASLQGPSTTSALVPVAAEGSLAGPSLNATITDTNAVAPSKLTVTINYGDGTPASTNQGPNADPNLLITQSATDPTKYTISDEHTFPEESGSTVPPVTFNVTLSVAETANSANTDTANTPAEVLDAPLTVGNPVNPGPGTITVGGNSGNTTSAAAALAAFEASIGGSKNTAAAPQNGGFRTITWDGVKTDGTDSVAGPNSTVVIAPGTVGIPLDRFQGQGVFFGAVYAVSKDGFSTVNPSVGPSASAPNGLFPNFSPPNTFAMFNDNGIDFKFVAPSAPNTALVPATSSAFGAIFLNVQQPGTTITYFNGNRVLDTLQVPTNPTPGAAVFAGEKFNGSVVTNVLLTLGNGVIFKFDGTNVTPGAPNSSGNNLVAVDDWAFAEPVPTANGFPIVSGPGGTGHTVTTINATAGTSFTGVVGTFSDLDPQANAKDFTAVINWGDGHQTNGTIQANAAGGFDVIGTNTYAQAGKFPVSVDVADFGGGPGVGGSQSVQSITNTANVVAAPTPPAPPPVAPPPPSGASATLQNQLFLEFALGTAAQSSPGAQASLEQAFIADFLMSSQQSAQETAQLVQAEISLAIDLALQQLGGSGTSLADQINSLETTISFDIPIYNTPAGYATGLLAGALTIAVL